MLGFGSSVCSESCVRSCSSCTLDNDHCWNCVYASFRAFVSMDLNTRVCRITSSLTWLLQCVGFRTGSWIAEEQQISRRIMKCSAHKKNTVHQEQGYSQPDERILREHAFSLQSSSRSSNKIGMQIFKRMSFQIEYQILAHLLANWECSFHFDDALHPILLQTFPRSLFSLAHVKELMTKKFGHGF